MILKVDLKDLVTRSEAAEIYGSTAQAFDYLVKRGYIEPIFSQGKCKLYLRDDVEDLVNKVLPVGRPRKVA